MSEEIESEENYKRMFPKTSATLERAARKAQAINLQARIDEFKSIRNKIAVDIEELFFWDVDKMSLLAKDMRQKYLLPLDRIIKFLEHLLKETKVD